jgi:antitoxin (DNA-binding transcriptional repressor) of toxin-antitoxin stability system
MINLCRMTVTIYQAKTHLSRILHHVEQGEEVVVCRGKMPVARIVPTDSAKPKRPRVGVPTSPRFDIPPEAFAPLGDAELKEFYLGSVKNS